MIAPDVLAAMVPIVAAFDEIGVPYYIGGSVASSVYGMARATLDVDLVADLRLEQVHRLVLLLQGAYYIDEEMIQEAIRHRSSFNLIHLETMVKVDVFLLKARPYDRQALQRARRDTLEEIPGAREFYLAAPEDVILNKLAWYRLGGSVSERQWNDVLGVIKVQAQALDFAYLWRWAGELGLTDLLHRAVMESGVSPSVP